MFSEKKFFGVKKSKFANRPKRALPKFRGNRSEVRGVNGRSKFVAASAGFAKRIQFVRVNSKGRIQTYQKFASVEARLDPCLDPSKLFAWFGCVRMTFEFTRANPPRPCASERVEGDP